MADLKKEADKIQIKVDAIQYPRKCEGKLEYRELYWKEKKFNLKNKVKKIYILPWLGTDDKILEMIKSESKAIIVTTSYSKYISRQDFELYSDVFDLTTFLEKEYWLGFIEYLIKTRDISQVVIADIKDATEIKTFLSQKFSEISIQDYLYSDNEKLYKRKINEYRIKNSLIGRAIRKISRCITKGSKKI